MNNIQLYKKIKILLTIKTSYKGRVKKKNVSKNRYLVVEIKFYSKLNTNIRNFNSKIIT